MLGPADYAPFLIDRRQTRTTAALERRKRNRRAYPRWILDFELHLRWGQQCISFRGYEIGSGGLSFLSETEIATDIELDVEYRLGPDCAATNVKGAVRHLEGRAYGLEFLNLGMKERLHLVEHCEELKLNQV